MAVLHVALKAQSSWKLVTADFTDFLYPRYLVISHMIPMFLAVERFVTTCLTCIFSRAQVGLFFVFNFSLFGFECPGAICCITIEMIQLNLLLLDNIFYAGAFYWLITDTGTAFSLVTSELMDNLFKIFKGDHSRLVQPVLNVLI